MSKMTDEENIKQKIKAIYPHIVVGGDIDKPYYTIHWYDIEQKTMICGFGSYKLELVHKWLEEEFEVVERDIDNLIKSQQAEIERLKNEIAIQEHAKCLPCIEETKIQAIKEFAERTNEMITEIYNKHIFGNNDLEAEEKDAVINFSDDITYRFNNLVKEMVGEDK